MFQLLRGDIEEVWKRYDPPRRQEVGDVDVGSDSIEHQDVDTLGLDVRCSNGFMGLDRFPSGWQNTFQTKQVGAGSASDKLLE